MRAPLLPTLAAITWLVVTGCASTTPPSRTLVTDGHQSHEVYASYGMQSSVNGAGH